MIKKTDNALLKYNGINALVKSGFSFKKVSSVTGRTMSYSNGKFYISGTTQGASTSFVTVLDSTSFSEIARINYAAYVAVCDNAKGRIYIGRNSNTTELIISDINSPYSILKSYSQLNFNAGTRTIVIDEPGDRVFFVGWNGYVRVMNRTDLTDIVTIKLPLDIYYYGILLQPENNKIIFSQVSTGVAHTYDYTTLAFISTSSTLPFSGGLMQTRKNNNSEVLLCEWNARLYRGTKDTLSIIETVTQLFFFCITQDDSGNVYGINETNGIYKII